jgi:hypothetical protein
MEKVWMDSTFREDAATTTREISRAFKESAVNQDKALRLALKSLKDLSVTDKQAFDATIAIKSALKMPKPRWQGLTADEFVYFCSYVDHETLDQIENTLRKRNVQT